MAHVVSIRETRGSLEWVGFPLGGDLFLAVVRGRGNAQLFLHDSRVGVQDFEHEERPRGAVLLATRPDSPGGFAALDECVDQLEAGLHGLALLEHLTRIAATRAAPGACADG